MEYYKFLNEQQRNFLMNLINMKELTFQSGYLKYTREYRLVLKIVKAGKYTLTQQEYLNGHRLIWAKEMKEYYKGVA